MAEYKLNPKQKKFCEEYAKCLNATRAAIQAGYSQKTARQQGTRLLSKAVIKQCVNKLLKDGSKKAELDLHDLLMELKNIAFCSISDFAKWHDGKVTLTPSKDLPANILRAVESVSQTTTNQGHSRVTLRLYNKLRAAELIMRIYEISETERRLDAIERKLEEQYA